MSNKKIGLLIGDEDDWPLTFEALTKRLGGSIAWKGKKYKVETERIRIHPFSLAAPTSYNLVIDRLAYWYTNPREWLKKAAMLNGTYLLNNPFTFQSMEKHTAYCAMMRAGLPIPETWLIPAKHGPTDPTFKKKYDTTAGRYNDLFDLNAIAEKIGYPLYMKPFDGGGWRGVSRIANQHDLVQQYDNSGQSMMHLQKSLEPYDVFVRSLAIGPQVMTMRYDPAQPSHNRYQVEHGFLSAEKGVEARQMVKLINSFFRWEFNSCECILKDDTLWAIDFANACPDIAVNSLHYYYPWAIGSLMKWSLFCLVTERPMRVSMNVQDYFAIADSKKSYKEKMAAYEKLADDYFDTARFEEFCAESLAHVDGEVHALMTSQEFEDILALTIRSIFPAHEQDHFIAHFRGLVQLWASHNDPSAKKPATKPAEAKPAGKAKKK